MAYFRVGIRRIPQIRACVRAEIRFFFFSLYHRIFILKALVSSSLELNVTPLATTLCHKVIVRMNYIKILKSKVLGDDPAEKIRSVLPVSESQFSCDPSECHTSFKESCFTLKGADASAPLYESAKPVDLHILVSTGKTDWEHDAFEEKGTILNLVNRESGKLAETCGINVKSNVTNDALDFSDPDSLSLNKLKVLLLPWFVSINGITKDNIEEIFDIIKTIVSDENNKGAEAVVLEEKLKNMNGVNVSKCSNGSYVLLCSHRTRDKRCGITAPIMKKEFDSQLRDIDLYRDPGDDRPDGVKVLFVNHVGGHKFAANVLIYNKHGEFVWFARCTPLNVKFMIEETVLGHKVNAEHVRACAHFQEIKW